MDVLDKVLQILPCDVTELNFCGGSPSFERKRNKNALVILQNLNKFDQLNRLSLDFQCLGTLLPSDINALEVMKGGGTLTYDGDSSLTGAIRTRIDGWSTAFSVSKFNRKVEDYGIVSFSNVNEEIVVGAFIQLREVIRKNQNLEYNLTYFNCSISGDVERTTFGAKTGLSYHVCFGTAQSTSAKITDFLKS